MQWVGPTVEGHALEGILEGVTDLQDDGVHLDTLTLRCECGDFEHTEAVGPDGNVIMALAKLVDAGRGHLIDMALPE